MSGLGQMILRARRLGLRPADLSEVRVQLIARRRADVSSLTGGRFMIASHPNKKDDSHAARRQRWACDRCGEKPLSEEIDLYFATGLCSWCSHVLAKDDD